MINFDIITIFPKLFDSFLNESIIKRAQKQKLIKVRIFDLRRWAKDPHKSVDDKPFGGGRGMVLKLEPIYKALCSLRKSGLQKSEIRNPKSEINPKSQISNSKTILFSPRGKKFSQKTAYQYSKLKRIVMVCGRYEGVDERVAKYLVDEQISIGDFVTMGGEVAAMAVIESVARLIPGVLGHSENLGERIVGNTRLRSASFGGQQGGFIEYPQYTRPEVFKNKWSVPKVLLTGHHKKIQEWREKHQKIIL